MFATGTYMQSIMIAKMDFWLSTTGPTPLYEDNMPVINMINNHVPTKRSRHIDIQYFAIRDWAEAKDIVILHIPDIPLILLKKALSWVLDSWTCASREGPFPELAFCDSFFTPLILWFLTHLLHPSFCLLYG